MSESDIRLQVCPVELFDTLLDSMGQLVSACVEGGASINFVLPFSAQDAQQWWSIQRESIEKGSAVLMLALAEDGKRVAGSVIMAPAWQPNGPHRAEVKKMLVHPDFQRRSVIAGSGSALKSQVLSLALTRSRICASASRAEYTFPILVQRPWARTSSTPGTRGIEASVVATRKSSLAENCMVFGNWCPKIDTHVN